MSGPTKTLTCPPAYQSFIGLDSGAAPSGGMLENCMQVTAVQDSVGTVASRHLPTLDWLSRHDHGFCVGFNALKGYKIKQSVI